MSKDMKNVNNWHWVDKNCINWAKAYFETNLVNITAEANGASVKTLAVTSVTGDVDVNQRKGKIITIFDVAITLTFEGTTADGTAATGKIEIPEVAHDTDIDDYVFDVTIDSDSSAKNPIRDLIRRTLAPILRKKLEAFAVDLIQVHGKDVQVDSDFPKSSTPVPSPSPAPSTPTPSAPKPVAVPGTVNTTTLNDSVELQASAHDIYDVLLNQAKVIIWTRSNKSTIEAKVGSKFSLFGGSVSGEIKELVEDKKIVQSWRQSSWPAGHYSTVTMDISQSTNSTVVKVKQEGVPVGEQDITLQNWSNYYWAEIKRTFGYVGLVSSATSSSSSRSMSNAAASSQSAPSPLDKKKQKRRRRDAKKARDSGGAGGVGMYTGAGLVVLTAFALGFWFSKK
ncbi:hypothetical protein BG011_002021 [Mortierella polycephala]|uniref:Activator of Hsp90 ATPase AHSA1-like N-terminal domain-containing protein n=1 Tax=Mortierella polycephala TaxID=41804 RepID=A0A9P6QG92_9FUNG|nr:hypothetical protein BG011_002021 [Mortierella polycephala]